MKKFFKKKDINEENVVNNQLDNESLENNQQQGGDFDFVPMENRVFEQKFTNKPTTFFKDAIKRFGKNKSSIVATVILLILIGMAIIVPFADKNNITSNNMRAGYLPPKWFDNANGFMDGTQSVSNVVLNPLDDSLPEDSGYREEALLTPITARSTYTSNLTDMVKKYGRGGDLVLSAPTIDVDGTIVSPQGEFVVDEIVSLNVVFDVEAMKEKNNETGLIYSFFLENDYDFDGKIDDVVELANNHGEEITESILRVADVNDLVRESAVYIAAGEPSSYVTYLNISVLGAGEIEGTLNGLYISSLHVMASVPGGGSPSSNIKGLDIDSGVKAVTAYRDTKDPELLKYVLKDGTSPDVEVYNVEVRYGSFRYDAYVNVYGIQHNQTFHEEEVNTFTEKGWMTYTWGRPYIRVYNFADLNSLKFKRKAKEGDFGYTTYDNKKYVKQGNSWVPYEGEINVPGEFTLTAEGEAYCPIRAITAQEYYLTYDDVESKQVVGDISWYRYDYYRGYIAKCEMPKFIFGTDHYGRDFFKMVFSGLLTSLGLGLMASIINIFIGIIWGSISGYFGGWVDLVMERITEILGGMPWIVMMTLIILLLGSNFWTFLLALCLTGWMGIANITREQFYRYKGREYVLASRTLGASDGRLIFRHILPNGIGTIVTSAVLMIPGVIFTEANISYLLPNLITFGNTQSFGITMSNVQGDIQYYPFLIVSASIIMALIMISFNLFGNGLRDAFNPSLKGSDE